MATADFEQVKVELENQRQMLQGLLKRRSQTDLNADPASASRQDQDHRARRACNRTYARARRG
jgi:hypothetical protein